MKSRVGVRGVLQFTEKVPLKTLNHSVEVAFAVKEFDRDSCRRGAESLASLASRRLPTLQRLYSAGNASRSSFINDFEVLVPLLARNIAMGLEQTLEFETTKEIFLYSTSPYSCKEDHVKGKYVSVLLQRCTLKRTNEAS